MKTKLLVIILTTLLTQSYAQNIKLFMIDKYNKETVLNCSEQQIYHEISKKRVVIRSTVVTLDLKIIKRNIGDTKSWLGITEDSTYYYITSISVRGRIGILFQPCDKDINRVDLPCVIIANFEICK